MNNMMKTFAGDDLDFYEEFLENLPEEQILDFFKKNPDFMKEYNIYEDRISLLKDKNYRLLMRKMKM